MRKGKKYIKRLIAIVLILVPVVIVYKVLLPAAHNSILPVKKAVGEPLDSLHGVKVYYNGGVGNVNGRNLTADGYNLGLRYQCVEFVKRYYYQHYSHKMPDSYGHAKSFYNPALADGELNKQRDLLQFKNGSASKPQAGDLLVFDGTTWNEYGHVAIISKAEDAMVEIIQQNPGFTGSSRKRIPLIISSDKHYIDNADILGWLRMK